jgi:type VI secretion system secreted protein VgrG
MGLTAKVRIEIDGEEIRDFVTFRISQSIYEHHEFEVKCRKESFEEPDTFLLEKSKRFIGQPIIIEIDGYTDSFKSSKPALFFKGLITDIKATKSGLAENDHIVLSGYSPDILLQDNPGCCSFSDSTIRQIADKILGQVPKDMLRSQVKPSNTDKHPFTVQYMESRYDFLRRLAVRYGEWFFYDGSELVLGPPNGKSFDLCLGDDLSDFAFSVRVNPLNVRSISYSPAKGGQVDSATNKSTGIGNLNEYGNYAHQRSMKLFSQCAIQPYNHLSTDESAYSTESQKVIDLLGSGLALSMSGASGRSNNPLLKVGGKAIIKAVREKSTGRIDYGEYIITKVVHQCDNLRNYSNEFSCIPGKSKLPDYTNPMAIPFCESQNAVVTSNQDPDGLGRIKVRFYWQPDGSESPWIRIVQPHAGPGSGFHFVPEVDDEVLIGFESGDAEKPYVQGSLYNGMRKPDGNWSSGSNDFKTIRTRTGNTIEIIDTDGREEIIIYQENDKSAAHHISLLSGADPTLTIFSKGKLVLEGKSIEIKSSQGSVQISSGSAVSVKSTTDTTIDAQNVTLDADMNIQAEAGMAFEAKGNATAKLEGGGQTEIKGGIVMIN